MHGPDSDTLHPVPEHSRIVFLKPLAEGRGNVGVGAYSYYDDPDAPEAFFERNVLYHFDFLGDRLEIGGFCAIGTGARIIMNGANHAMAGFSTFPFNIFGRGWEAGFDIASYTANVRGDTVIGNDVWIGARATILPGVRIGDGAIIGTEAVVGSDVPPYAIVAGNPGRVLRTRFDPATIDELLSIAWWNWPPETITEHLAAIRGANIAALRAARNQTP
ncbi:streptogramin A acetyl transferase [Agaricicola taiwanensis]|uniref:Streptogramin A acetyl transferase n=1 Tax=Agaricicola taiwanensis TaxID=591372 RepID=A0A8J2VMJ8_9RHOB|nr:CatB-related O-acetyltransferase [Agaricicola taiwanensis]GGE33496.1 streptogramin A acetyl transferase [Agaricicola taiwanensis]